MSFTDADLIARVLSGDDQHAFGELVRRHQSPVRAFLRRMTHGDAHAADDLAQETFLKAWQKMPSYRGEAKFSTWLLGIAFNEFRGHRRKGRADSWEDARREPEESTPESPVEIGLDLTAALRMLNSNERAAIILCCQNGMSHEEAAVALGARLGTIKTNVMRGKEKLRQYLSAAYAKS